MVAVVECGTHAVFAAGVGPLYLRATALAWRLFCRFRSGMLVLADRGFRGFDLWRAVCATGADLLGRVRSDAVPPVVGGLADGWSLSRIVAARDTDRRADPAPVRVIEHTLGPGADATVYRLITTILDPQATPAAELAALSHRRWESANTWGEIKTHRGGPRRVPRSWHPAGAEPEIFAFLLVRHAPRDLMRQAARRADQDPGRISFTRTPRVARRLPGQAAFPPSRLARALTAALRWDPGASPAAEAVARQPPRGQPHEVRPGAETHPAP